MSFLDFQLPGRQFFDATVSQHARLLRLSTPLPGPALLVEHFSGREGINELFRFTLDCLSTSAYLELTALTGEEVTLRLLQADGSTRCWHGVVTSAWQLGSDGGLSRYRLIVEPWLALLGHRRNSQLFQDQTVVDIAHTLFGDYPMAQARFAVNGALPERPLVTQYRESDLDFLLRRLAYEGLSFYFEHDPTGPEGGGESAGGEPAHPQAHHRLVICDRSHAWSEAEQSQIRFRRLSATEAEDAIHTFSAWRRVETNRVVRAAWDTTQLTAPAAELASSLELGPVPMLEDYDGAAANLHPDSGEAERLARVRLEGLALRQKTFAGDSSVRQLAAGRTFNLLEHPDYGAASWLDLTPTRPRPDNRFLLLAVEHEAANNLNAQMSDLLDPGAAERGTYRNRFECVNAAVPVQPVVHITPTALGFQTARVVGLSGEVVTTERDHRVKIQFPWQRGTQPNPGGSNETASTARPEGRAPGDDTSGLWVRVAEWLAGPNFGSQFNPRIGDEVLVEFVDGDIDRPLIAGLLYNGEDLPPLQGGHDADGNHPGFLSGIHLPTLDGGHYNQWVVDDHPGQLRQRLATSRAATQLNLGHLIHQSGASGQRGSYRGTGFELRTDAWGGIRAERGLLLSATARQNAISTVHDVKEPLAQLKAAEQLGKTLNDAASHHQALPLKAHEGLPKLSQALDGTQAKPTRSGDKPAEAFNSPAMLLDTPAAAFFTTPASALCFSGQNLSFTVQDEALYSASHTYSSVSGQSTSLFTHQGGIQAIAAQGPISLQAHTDTLEVLADQSLTITSSKTSIEVLANQQITLKAGGSAIILQGPNITFACPGLFSVKGSQHEFLGPGTGKPMLSALPQGVATEPLNFIELTHHYDDLEPVQGATYKVFYDDGTVLQGTVDSQGFARQDGVPRGGGRVEWGEDVRNWQAQSKRENAHFGSASSAEAGAALVRELLK